MARHGHWRSGTRFGALGMLCALPVCQQAQQDEEARAKEEAARKVAEAAKAAEAKEKEQRMARLREWEEEEVSGALPEPLARSTCLAGAAPQIPCLH